jgi:hypothetical protein
MDHDDVGGGQSLTSGRQHEPGFPTVSTVLRIVFSLFALFPAPAAFLSPLQGLAL